MADIKTINYNLTVPSARGEQVGTVGVPDKGYSKARPARYVDTGGGELARSIQYFGHSMIGLSGALAKKEEELRATNSALKEEDMKSDFVNMREEMYNRTGEKAYGMLNEWRESYDDLKEQYLTDDLDDRTRKELELAFNREFRRHTGEVINWQSQQASVARKDLYKRNKTNAYKYINSLPTGNIAKVKAKAFEDADLQVSVQPNINERDMQDIRNAYMEDYLTHAYTAWFTDNPTAGKISWEQNKESLKKLLPNNYTTLNAKYERAVKQSNYNVLSGQLMEKYGGNDAAIIDDINKNWQKYIDSGVDASQLQTMQSFYQGRYNFKISRNEKAKKERADAFFTSTRQKFTDQNGVFNNVGYLAELEKALYKGTIDYQTFNIAKSSALSGEFSTAQHNALVKDIQDGVVTTTGQIDTRVLGTGAHADFYYRQLKAIKDDMQKGFKVNYINEAGFKYSKESQKKKETPKEELLPDPAMQPDFERDLRMRIIKEGITPYNPKTLDIANEMLQSGWYSKKEPGFHPGTEYPGWDWLAGAHYTRKWQYEAQFGKTPTQMIEGENVEDDLETKAAKEYLKTKNLPATPDNIQRAKLIDKIRKSKETK